MNGKGREMFRYQRGGEVRVYNLCVVPGGTQLWRVTETPGLPPRSVKEEDFKSAEVALAYIEEVERTLTAGGWRLVSAFNL